MTTSAPESKCQHENFESLCDVGRLSEEVGGPITGYTIGVRIKCQDCGLPFRFIGVGAGSHYAEPRVSIDGCELRAPIEPAEHEKFLPNTNYTLPPRIKQ